ncbi:DUF411 domain-containing protein [Sphingopyxis sp. P8]|nr:DUF411 domain-containing protein [Sphingopyxis sp. P8]
MTLVYDRRKLVLFGTLIAGATLAGCNRGMAADAGARDGGASDDGVGKAMLVYRDPGCSCCEDWAEIARVAGYRVEVVNRADMTAVKTRYGVPADLASCHTAIIGDYAIEGHVPMPHVAKLIDDRPRGIVGLAVPGMPRGSPGMEMADGTIDPFEVMAFDRAGNSRTYRA